MFPNIMHMSNSISLSSFYYVNFLQLFKIQQSVLGHDDGTDDEVLPFQRHVPVLNLLFFCRLAHIIFVSISPKA